MGGSVDRYGRVRYVLKEQFVAEASVFEELGKSPKVLVVAVLLPSGATEIIQNTELLFDKMNYYKEQYDDMFRLKANPNVRIVNFMIV